MKKIILSEELAKQICDRYLSGCSLSDVGSFFNLSKGLIRKTVAERGLLRSREESKQIELETRKRNCRAKYGVDFFMQTPEYAEKAKATNRKRYGTDWQIASRQTISKANGSKLERYSSANYNNRSRARQTCLDRYGESSYVKTQEFKSKAAASCLAKYSADNYAKTDEFKAFYQENKSSIKAKEWATKLKNGTFNSSKPEDEFYEALVALFGAEDVFRQYRDARYPFRCDFYVKSLDAFVELNLSWTHGGHRFDQNSAEDSAKLDLWKKKAEQSKYYEIAIETWTGRDVRKFEAAEASGIRYHACYSLKEAYALLS